MFLPRLNHTALEMYILELAVFEKYHSCGVGKKLASYCVALAKKKKCHRIRLESANNRRESHQFYKKLGFAQLALSFTVLLTYQGIATNLFRVNCRGFLKKLLNGSANLSGHSYKSFSC